MKRILKLILPLLAVAACGCSENNEPEQIFAGRDNSVTSFALTTAGGVRYEAAISGDRIEITVPETCSLEGAKAEYTICEQAVLYPDPAGISDWDNEHRFRVMAYNETVRDYFYSVRRSDVASAGTVVLLTQSEVDAFAGTGVSVIEGSLIIGSSATEESDPVIDLSPLGHLTEVRYDIVVNSSFRGENLDGLENVVRAGGLVIGSSVAAVELENGLTVSMPSLESLGQLHINCSGVVSLQFPQLRSIGQVYVDGRGLAMMQFPKLESCDGHMKFSSGAGSTSTGTQNTLLAALELPELQYVRGLLTIEKFANMQILSLPHLVSVDGPVNLSTLPALEAVSLPELKRCAAFTANNLNSASDFSLPVLAEVAGDFKITGSTAAQSNGVELTELQRVGGTFQLNQNMNTERLSLPKLTYVGGDFDLRYLRSMTTLEIPNLSHVGMVSYSLYLYYLDALEYLDISKIDGLAKLQIIGCSSLARISAAAVLNDVTFNAANVQNVTLFPTFEQPTTIAGTLTYQSYRYTAATEIEIRNIVSAGTLEASFSGNQGAFLTAKFSDLKTVGNFTCTNAYWLKSLVFPTLTEVTGKMEIVYSQYMENGGLVIPELRRINELVFNGATYANGANNFKVRTTLEDFAGVGQIDRLTIKWWGAITDFSGLKKAAAADGDWTIAENRIDNAVVFNPSKQDILDGNCIYEQ